MTATETLRDTAPWDIDADKLREECGIFGVIGTKEAAGMVALGLHALQHRGQEAVGITSYDGQEFYSHRGIGHVAQVSGSGVQAAGFRRRGLGGDGQTVASAGFGFIQRAVGFMHGGLGVVAQPGKANAGGNGNIIGAKPGDGL